MSQNGRGSIVPILILGALFFVFGFVTWLNGTLIPYLRIACELSDFQSLFVTFAFYIAYFVMALPSAWVLQRTGFKRGMMLGLVIMAAGALLFVPAAQTRTYGIFLTGLFVIATGLSLLQTAANPYVTVIGPIESAARRISIMGVCNKVAGVLAPMALGYIVLHDADDVESRLAVLSGLERSMFLDELAARVVVPYALFSIAPLLFAFLLRSIDLPDLQAEPPQDKDNMSTDGGSGPLSHPNLALGVMALFLYVGTEVIAGDTIPLYGQAQGLPLSEAKHLTSYTLVCMVVGYLFGIAAIPRLISQSLALGISAALGVIITVAAILLDGYASVLCIALLGLANALVWPAIWPLAIQGLGRHTKTGSALLIMAIAGGALLPLLYGRLAASPFIGPQQAYWMLVPCYLFIGWYALRGARMRHWR